MSGSPPGYLPQYSGSPPVYPPQYTQQQYPFSPFQPPQSLPPPGHAHLAVPTNDEHSACSAPAGNLAVQVPPLLRTMSYDGDHFRRFHSCGTFARRQQYFTERAKEILEFEEQHMGEDEVANTVQHQPSYTIEHHIIADNNDPVQYPVVDQRTQPPVMLQRQFSEFPLDQVRV